eukprot:m.152482 g.152482  ORF g.152482 m.152482 type:complete len:70 (+) comp17893_c0_seq18:213-422(+)
MTDSLLALGLAVSSTTSLLVDFDDSCPSSVINIADTRRVNFLRHVQCSRNTLGFVLLGPRARTCIHLDR